MAAVVLLSGGLDSATNFKCALDRGGVALAVTFRYGQRSVEREVEAARAMCRRFDVKHRTIDLSWLAEECKAASLQGGANLPELRESDLDDAEGRAAGSADAVWIPNRNGLFLNAGAALAENIGADCVVVGFNAEEGATFPDNSSAFVDAANAALRFSTRGRVRVVCETLDLRKPEVLRLGMEREAPLDLVWPCYRAGERLCGRCESCLRFLRAVREAGAEDWFRLHHRRYPEG